MAFNIEFYREGRLLGASPWPNSFEKAVAHARSYAKIHRADFARIVDVDGSGAEVWSERNDA